MGVYNETDGYERIEVRLPLPLNVAAALQSAVGTIWPDAMIEPAGVGRMIFAVPYPEPPARTAEEIAENLREVAATLEEQNADQTDTGTPRLHGIDKDGTLTLLTDPTAYTQVLGWAALSMLTAVEGAANYVEQVVHVPDDLIKQGHPGQVVFTAAWSKGQTPAALRQKAEADLAAARQEIERLTAQVEALRADHATTPKREADQ